jgi:hypothetical protein
MFHCLSAARACRYRGALVTADDDSEFHLQRCVLSVMRWTAGGKWRNELPDWDMMIAHPPCTYLSRAGARWWKCVKRQKLADEAAEFVFALRDAPIQHIAIENPIGQLNQRWRYPDQTIQPYEFGHPYSKATCLWLKNLPPLFSTLVLADHKPLIRSNVTARNRAGKPQPGLLSGGIKTAITFDGIAAAMADQWGAVAERLAA